VFCAAKNNLNYHGLSVSSENASQKMFIGDDTISEIVNDSGSEGGNFSKLSNEACKVRPVPVAVRSNA
jgi:hypothetical protein